MSIGIIIDQLKLIFIGDRLGNGEPEPRRPFIRRIFFEPFEEKGPVQCNIAPKILDGNAIRCDNDLYRSALRTVYYRVFYQIGHQHGGQIFVHPIL